MDGFIQGFFYIIADSLGVTARARHPSDTMRLAVSGVNMVKSDGCCADEFNPRTGKQRLIHLCACAHDENISVISTEGVGTEFTFSLTLSET